MVPAAVVPVTALEMRHRDCRGEPRILRNPQPWPLSIHFPETNSRTAARCQFQRQQVA